MLPGKSKGFFFVPDRFLSEQIVVQFPEPLAGKRILIPRAKVAPDQLPEKLREQGAEVRVVPVYETVTEESDCEGVKEMLSAGQIAVITFTSSSTVSNLHQLVAGASVTGAAIACIGPVTANTARSLGYRVDIEASEHTIEGLVRAIIDWRTGSQVVTDA